MSRFPRAGLALLVLIAVACSKDERGNGDRSPVPERGMSLVRWDVLARRKIFFGHMSVGFNIVQGIQEVVAESPRAALDVVETREPRAFARPLFAHSRNGKNYDPISKIDGFVETMDAGVGARADIAFFKLCFVDVRAQTDVGALFEAYRDAMKRLRARYPALMLVHVTVPLTAVEGGMRAAVKQVIGRAPDGYLDNVRRHEFNELLRAEYRGKEPVFDLAAVESRAPTGAWTGFRWQGRFYTSLTPEYTFDGGHLNEDGRRRAARELLAVLGEVAP